MKTIKSPLGFKLQGVALLMMAMGGGMFSHLAQANTSAGTILRNSVTVDYTDVNSVAQTQETASVDVIVDLVPVVAWGVAPSDQTVQSGQSLPSAYTITLSNLGNGSDTYTITDNTSESCTTGSLGVESFGFTTPVTLGATVSSGAGVFASPNTTIPVSNLVAAHFAATDTVIIAGNSYVVVSATSDGDGTTPDSLVVVGDASTDVAAAGVQIGERITFSYGGSGSAGTLSAGATGCEHAHELVADGTLATGGNTDAQDTVNGWSTFVEGVQLSVVKYVRNVTDNAKNSGLVAITYDSVDYYTSGVSGNPGDDMEYLVVITNGSAGTANNVEFNDTLPSFTTYTVSSLEVDTDGDEIFDVVLPADETEADGEGGIVTQSGQSIQVFAGTGGDEDTNTGGTVTNLASAPNNKTAVKYTITID
jgi:uncharacterized repeat protein (TIGR01451 family)